MPCHEHGVWLDGFQEESNGDEDLEKGSAEERRERRVCPSGEREVIICVLVKNTQK